jgi:HK97 family phage prohead protease
MSERVVISRLFVGPLDVEGDGRTIVGRCIPYDVPTRVADEGNPEPYVETWKRGAFRAALRDPGRIHLVWNHDETAIGNQLGHAVSFLEDAGGLDGTFRAVGTPGDQALELIRSGMARGLSVHAAISPSGSRTRNGVVERTLARLIHVALVTQPAYEDAVVTAVRSSSGSVELADVRAKQDAYRLRFPPTSE